MRQQTIRTIITYLYYTLFLVTPFIVLPITSELFEFNKIIFIYAVAGLIFSLWIVDSLNRKSLVWHRTPFDIPILLFYLSQIFSFIFSIDQHTSFFGYYGRFNGGLLSLSVYLFLYYGFAMYVAPQKNAIRTILGIVSVALILVFLWGVPGLVNRDLSCLLFVGTFDNSCWTAQFRPAERMFSTLGQPNWLGAYAAVSFFTGGYLLLTTKKRAIAVLAAVTILSAFCAILFSRSRSALLSLVPGTVFFSFAIFALRKQLTVIDSFKRKVIIGLLVVLVLALFGIKTGISAVDNVLTFQFNNNQQQGADNEVQKNLPAETETNAIQVGGVTESLDIRKIVWKGAWELGLDYPLFGTGLETFGYAYYHVRPKEHNLTSEWDYLYNKAHNEFLHIFATSGWTGIVMYIVLMVWIVIAVVRQLLFNRTSHISDTFLSIYLLSAFGSMTITNLFGFSTTTINVFWYLFPALIPLQNTTQQTHEVHKPGDLKNVAVGGFIAIFILNYLVAYWYADYLYAQSDALAKNGAIESSIVVLDKARSLRHEHVYDDKLSYLLAQVAFSQVSASRKETVPQLIAQSDQLNMQSIRASKYNVLYWKTRVKNQYLFYQATLDKKHLFTGLSALEESAKLAPTDPKIPYFASTYYTLLFDDEQDPNQKKIYMTQSLASVEEAITLKNNYIDAYTLKIQLLKKYQQKERLKETLEFYLGNIAPGDQSAQEELKAL